jgi:hypothetical protein
MYSAIFEAQLDREYGRTEAALFDADLETFVSRLGLNAPIFQACLVSDRAAERLANDAGTAVVLGVDATPAVMVGTRADTRVKVARFFDRRPDDTQLFEVIDDLLALAPSQGK